MIKEIAKHAPIGATHWQAGTYYKENDSGVWFVWDGYWKSNFQWPGDFMTALPDLSEMNESSNSQATKSCCVSDSQKNESQATLTLKDCSQSREAFERFYVSTGLNQSGLDWNDEFKVYRSDITHYMFLSWQQQQKTIDRLIESENNIARGCEAWRNAHHRVDEENITLRARIDAALKMIPSLQAENDLWGCDQVARQIELLEQALRGGQ